MLASTHGWQAVAAATERALEQGSARRATIERLLRLDETNDQTVAAVPIQSEELAAVDVPQPDLSAYDALGEVAA